MTMRIIFCCCFIGLLASTSFAGNVININDTIKWQRLENKEFDIYYTPGDEPIFNSIKHYLHSGVESVNNFFGHAFVRKFDVYIFPNRISLDRQWQTDWNDPGFKSQCWMIASGVAHRLDLLSPRTWNKEACDHNADDTMEIRQVTWHELVHVFHGQQNPDHTFSYVEKLDWLVEGVATYVSGQLTEKRLQRIKQMIAENKTPSTLDDFWKGSDRYGLSGSIVAYIDKTYDRKKLFELLRVTNKQDALQLIGITEKQLITDWQRSFK